MNKVQLIGGLGIDQGCGVVNRKVFSNIVVGTNEHYINRERENVRQTTWHRVTCWGRIAEFSNDYLCTVRRVLVEGRLQHGQYVDREDITRVAVEVVVQRLTALDPKPEWMSERKGVEDQHGNNVNQTLKQ